MKIIKNPIFTFILGSIIFGTIGVMGATYLYQAKDVSYNDTNVESAINDLYDKFSPSSENKLIPTLIADTNNIIKNFNAYNSTDDIYQAYNFFDDDDTTGLYPHSQDPTIGSYIGYIFNEEHYVNYIKLLVGEDATGNNFGASWEFKIQYYDGINWNDIGGEFITVKDQWNTIFITKKCYGVRMYFTGGYTWLYGCPPNSCYTRHALLFKTFQAYGY